GLQIVDVTLQRRATAIGDRAGADPLRRRCSSGRSRHLGGPLVIFGKREVLARPAPSAPGGSTLARLDAGEALVDIRDAPEPSHLPIGYDVDAGFGLFLHHLGD